MDFENLNIWYWLIPLLVGVICGILGYLMGKSGDTSIDNSAELKSLRDKNSRLQSDLDACNKKLTAKPSGTANGSTGESGGRDDSSSLGSTVGAAAGAGSSGNIASATKASDLSKTTSEPKPSAPTVVAFDAAAAKTALGKSVNKDDLKIIEGIGPKIEEMFQGAGIKTWKALSETSVASCQEILTSGGERYKIHDPASWPMQAKMCYEGKWRELVRWQDEHDHGKL
ncbi:MAG: hypothetical protein WA913_10680 [Pricia sp.]